MAEEMKHHAWDDYGKRRLKADVRYPWHLWLNGSMWYLIKGEDFDCSIKQFQQYAHGYAKNWGIKIKTQRDEWDNGLYIKAYAATSKRGLRRSRHFRSMDRRINEMREWGTYEYHYPELEEDDGQDS